MQYIHYHRYIHTVYSVYVQCNNVVLYTGTGDMLSLCCVHVTQTADTIVTANKYAESAGYYSLIEPPSVEVSVDGSLSIVRFDNTNPGIPVYKTVVIRNYRYMYSIQHDYIHCKYVHMSCQFTITYLYQLSHMGVHVHIIIILFIYSLMYMYSGVRLSYQWCYYHPRTELSHDTISPLVPVTSCPFVLEHSGGIMELLPGETKLIPLVYTPSKVQYRHVALHD